MNVRLTTQLQQFVKRQVALGRYVSDAEVIRHGLRLLQEEIEWRVDVRQQLAAGVAQAKTGQLVDAKQALDALLASVDDAGSE